MAETNTAPVFVRRISAPVRILKYLIKSLRLKLMKTRSLIAEIALSMLLVSSAEAADIVAAAVAQSSIRAMDFKSLPSDANSHHRTKWSNDFYIYMDYDIVAPSLFVFDRTGKQVWSTTVSLPSIDSMLLTDYGAAPDGSVWASGFSNSRTGQQAAFLIHVSENGTGMQVIRTNPFWPNKLSVAPDGTVWTTGYDYYPASDTEHPWHSDAAKGMLRHFDLSGKILSSAVPPVAGEDFVAKTAGFLSVNRDRVAWLAKNPDRSVSYLEYSPETKIVTTYSAPPSRDRSAQAFALTSRGRAFVVMAERFPTGNKSSEWTLYELNRGSNEWLQVQSPVTYNGHLVDLVGNDGDSLVFMGPPDKSKLTAVVLPPSH